MKKQGRIKFLSALLVVVMLLSSAPLSGVVKSNLQNPFSINAQAANGVKTKLDNVIARYPNGNSWTQSFDEGRECFGFAKMVIHEIFGKENGSVRSWSYSGANLVGMTKVGSITNFSANNVKNLLSSARCGDVLQFNTTKQHTMIVYSVDTDGVTVYDCNWTGPCVISYRKSSFGAWSGRNCTSLSLLRSTNYDQINGEDPTPPDVSHNPIGDINSVTGGNKCINVSGWAFDPDDKSESLLIHIYVYREGNENDYECIGFYANQVSTDVNSFYGTTGNHRFEYTFNLQRITGNVRVDIFALNIDKGENTLILSHNVKVTSDKPQIRNVKVFNFPTGYNVFCDVSDDIGVTSVKFPTWILGQTGDDAIWLEGVVKNGKAECWIDKSNFNNQNTLYFTHIYAYDADENFASYDIGSVPIYEKLLEYTNVSEENNGNITLNVNSLKGMVRFWFREYNTDPHYRLDFYVDNNEVLYNARADVNGFASCIVDTTKLSNGKHTVRCEMFTTYSHYTETKEFTVSNYITTFNPCSGTVSTTSKYVAVNQAYGTLPTPTRSGYTFLGWFTSQTGGTKVTDSSICTVASNHTLYAHWVVNEFKAKDDSPINIDNAQKFVYGFSREKLTEETIKEQFINKNIQVTSSNGLFGTGTKIALYDEALGVINEATVVFFGDVNGDGWYDGMDALLVSCLESGMLSREQVGEAVWFAADCNHDGEVDFLDVQILQQAGLILSEIDQNKSTQELLQTTAYLDYVELIDQIPNLDIQEPTESLEPEQSIFGKIIAFIVNIFTIVIKFF